MGKLKLGLQMGYWGSGPPPDAAALVLEAERLGYDSVWTAEAYGSDALTPLAWWGAATTKVRLGTALCQLSARTPTAMAMAALTLDPPVGGSLHPRSRSVGTAGGRRLVRPGLLEASGPHPRVRVDRAPGARPPSARQKRRAPLPVALPRWPRPR